MSRERSSGLDYSRGRSAKNAYGKGESVICRALFTRTPRSFDSTQRSTPTRDISPTPTSLHSDNQRCFTASRAFSLQECFFARNPRHALGLDSDLSGLRCRLESFDGPPFNCFRAQTKIRFFFVWQHVESDEQTHNWGT